MSKIVSKIAEFLDNEENKDCLYTLMTTYFREKALKSDLSTVFVIVYGEDTLLGSVPKSTHREADYHHSHLRCHIKGTKQDNNLLQ